LYKAVIFGKTATSFALPFSSGTQGRKVMPEPQQSRKQQQGLSDTGMSWGNQQ